MLAALGSPTWGMYSGYELVENVARPGAEEQIDNEKYEYKLRDWAAVDTIGIALLARRLNEIRHAHPALQQLRTLTVHPTSDDALVCFSRHVDAEHSPTGRADTVLVVVTIDPHRTREGMVYLDLAALGVPADDDTFVAHDVLSHETYTWGRQTYVRLDPLVRCAHVVHVEHT